MTEGRGPRLGKGREFRLIESALANQPVPGSEIVLGWGDDAAVVRGGTLAVSTDLCVEGVHFRREWMDASEIGYRATVAALSDMAAMAADPIAVLLSVALPPSDEHRFGALVAGVREAVAAYDASLVGGDLARAAPTSSNLVLDVVCMGSVTNGGVLRSGGRPGDEVWVTGVLGGAASAVSAWTSGHEPERAARRAFARPVARVAEARWLHDRDVFTALIDVSDGVTGDLGHLAVASAVDVELESRWIPRFEGVSAESLAWDGGEDYELVFFAPPGSVEPLRAQFADRFGVELTRIGETVAGNGEVRVDGRPGPRRAFDHFESSR